MSASANEGLGIEYVDLYLVHWPAPEKRADTWHALLELKERGKARGIVVEAYRPLARGMRMQDPNLVAVAQIMLRSSLPHGYVVIPQSAHPKRIEENADMAVLDNLYDGFRATGLNPSDVP